MLDRTDTKFSHVKPGDTEYVSGGLRDFFLYRDLGIAEATHGKVIAHLVKANMAPEAGTGWHRHEAEFQIVIMVKGWARFMYEDQETLVEAGDVVHQRPGIRHYLFDYSPRTWSTSRSSRRPISRASMSSRPARFPRRRHGSSGTSFQSFLKLQQFGAKMRRCLLTPCPRSTASSSPTSERWAASGASTAPSARSMR